MMLLKVAGGRREGPHTATTREMQFLSVSEESHCRRLSNRWEEKERERDEKRYSIHVRARGTWRAKEFALAGRKPKPIRGVMVLRTVQWPELRQLPTSYNALNLLRFLLLISVIPSKLRLNRSLARFDLSSRQTAAALLLDTRCGCPQIGGKK